MLRGKFARCWELFRRRGQIFLDSLYLAASCSVLAIQFWWLVKIPRIYLSKDWISFSSVRIAESIFQEGVRKGDQIAVTEGTGEDQFVVYLSSR